MTSLNLFASRRVPPLRTVFWLVFSLTAYRFDQVLQILDKRKASVDYVFIDTPGQVGSKVIRGSGFRFVLNSFRSKFSRGVPVAQ